MRLIIRRSGVDLHSILEGTSTSPCLPFSLTISSRSSLAFTSFSLVLTLRIYTTEGIKNNNNNKSYNKPQFRVPINLYKSSTNKLHIDS